MSTVFSRALPAGQADVLRAIRDARPGPSGVVKLAALVDALRAGPATSWTVSGYAVDRALVALRRLKLVRYLGSHDHATGRVRRRWGWVLTAAGRRAAS